MAQAIQAAYFYYLQRDPLLKKHNLNCRITCSNTELAFDGRSAGLPFAAAILSTILGKPIKTGIAMTGHVALSGVVLPVGGIEQKLGSASDAGIHTVILPIGCRPEVESLSPERLGDLKIVYVQSVQDLENVIF